MQSIVKWLRERVESAGAKGLVLGLSGGVDSAVVGALVRKAFPENSKGLILPCYSSPQDVEHGKRVAEALGLSYDVLNLTQAHQTIMEGFHFAKSEDADAENHAKSLRASDSNLRARLRMSAIYAFANYHGYLTVGTDNAAELHIGYFTKYGDGGVDLLPIAELLKCEVFMMARMLGIPKEVVYKAPSAGLWEGQTDEGEIGVRYDEIDCILMGERVDESSKEIVARMHRNSEHKRQTPPYPKLK
ncbi:MAG: NAD(+) synthase [Bacillota bacterium]|nr:NAD(+) synthase [Bacillota bacterium]